MPPQTGRGGAVSPLKVVRQFKVSLFGESAVGKSSILHRFDSGVFKGNLMSTVGMDFRTCVVSVDGLGIGLKIWDTAGQERFRTLTEQHYRGAKGLVLTYDVGSSTSFDKLRGWLHSIEQHGLSPQREVIFIVGNKIDLEKDSWRVDVKKAQEFADQHCCQHFLTSAKTGEGIEEVFLKMAVCLKDAFGPHFVEGEQADKRVWRHADVDRPKLEHMESFHLEKQALAVPSCCAK